MKAPLARGTFRTAPLSKNEALVKRLFTTHEVAEFIETWFPTGSLLAEVETVPYASEDGQPRVMLGRNGSYCSLELPLDGADLLYYATMLIVFGGDE